MTEDKEQQNSYKSITKATAIFGGTQMANMAATIIKGKLSALLIGAYGLGISAHLYSSALPIQQIFTCGLNMSAVQTISSTIDERERTEHVICLRRMIMVLATMATVTTMASAWWLSQLTFGTTEHWPWFVTIAFAIGFLILASGEATILQGHRKLKALAACNMAAPVAGLLVSIPLYFLWGIEGIAPSIALLGIISWITARYFTHKIQYDKNVRQTWSETLSKGRKTIVMGASIMISNIVGSIATYAINTCIGNIGNEADVGFYQAATNITIQCTSMVFTAMATDYFPHLSSIIRERAKAQDLTCKEGEMTILVIAPIVLILITFAPVAIRVLLTREFDAIIFLLRAMSLCLISRAVCFPLDYICLAHGDNKFFMILEGGWSNIETVGLVLAGYALGGIDGIGIALLIRSVIDVIVSIVVNRWRYKMTYSSKYYKMASILTIAAIACFAFSFIKETWIAFTLMTIITIITGIFAYRQIDQRINIMFIINNRIHGKNKCTSGCVQR